jgi:hypothetical protein
VVAISVGSVAVDVVPSVKNFAKDLQKQLLPQAAALGAEIGKTIGTAIAKGIGDPLSGPLDESAQKQRSKAPRQGDEVAGAFAKAYQNRLRAAFESLPEAKVDADTSEADRKIEEIRRKLQALSGRTVGVDIDAGQALAEISAIQADLNALDRSENVQVRVDAAAAAGELAALQAEVDKLDRSNPTVHADADVSGALSGIGILAASVGALAAIPVGATLGAGILSLLGPLGAAGSGFGGLAAVAIPSISHVSDALKAQTQAATASAAGAAQVQGRALAEAGAQQQLAAAVRNAGFAHQQALQQVTSAQQQLTTAEQSAVNAERALTAARATAQRQLQDMANQVVDAQLAVRQSTFDVADAQSAYNKVVANPQSSQDQIARAKLALDQAKQNLKEQQLDLKRLRADQAAADKAGVDGSNAVRSARQQLASANQQVAASERALASARANVARTDQNSADQVAAARRAVVQASLQGASANSKLAASMAALTGPERNLLRDVQGLRAAFTSWARSLQPDVLPLFSRGISLLEDQLPNLTPFVHGAAGAVDGLITDVGNAAKSPFWTQFRNNLANLVPTAITNLGHSAGNVITGLTGIVNAFLPYAPALLGWITRITGAFANWGKGLGSSDGFSKFMQYVQQAGPQVWQTVIQIARAVGNIVTSLASFGPTALLGIRGLATVVAGMSPGEIQAIALAFLAVRAAILANNIASSVAAGVTAFSVALKSGGDEGPIFARSVVLAGRGISSAATAAWSGVSALGRFAAAMATTAASRTAAGFSSAASAIGRVATAAWSGVTALGSLALSYGRAAAAAALSAARTVVFTVAQNAVRVATLAWTAVQWLLDAALSANPIGIVIVAIGALVAAVIYAYTHFGWFRTAVQAAWLGIRTAALFAWNYALKPIFDLIKFYILNILVPYYRFLWTVAVAAFRGIAAVALWLWHNAIHPAWTGIKAVIGVAWAGIKLYLKALELEWRLVASVARWLWHNVMVPVWNGIRSVISSVWNGGIKPVFNAVRSAIGRVGDAFRAGASAIKTAWSKIKDYTKAPVNFVIGTVYDKGIVGLWNKVMGWLHLPNNLKLGTVPMLASGGELSAAQSISPMVTNRPTAIVGEGGRHPEYVIPTDPKYRGRAQALWAAAGGDLQMLAGGGILGSVLKTVKGVAGKVVNVGKDALDLLADPKKIWDRLASPILNQAKSVGTSDWGKAVAAIPPKMLDEAWVSAKQIIDSFKAAFGGGGSAMVDLAKTQIGYHEGAGNSNKYSRALGRPAEEWCADFIDWLALKTNNRSAVPWTASAPGMANAFGGRYHSGTSGAVAGDILFFGGSKAGIYHVGLASGPGGGGSVPTIAGNSSNMVRAYTGTGIAGYAHPAYPNPGSGIVSPGSLVHASPAAAKGWARQNLKTQGWGQDQFSPLERLWNRECVPLRVRILTRRGWLTCDEVQVGDETIGYNQRTGRNEWTVITAVHKYGPTPVKRFGNEYWSVECTANHRWLTEDMGTRTKYAPRPERTVLERREVIKGEGLVELQHLRKSQRVVLARPMRSDGALPITLQEAALLGWIAGDGTFTGVKEYWYDRGEELPATPEAPFGYRRDGKPKKNRSGAPRKSGQHRKVAPFGFRIGQAKQQHFAAIEAACAGDRNCSHYIEYRPNRTRPTHIWRLSTEYSRDLLARAGNPKTDAVDQVLAMSDEQRAAWLDAIIAAEGTRDGNRVVVYQDDGPVADAIELAIYLSGHRPSRTKDCRRGKVGYRFGMVSPHVGGQGRRRFVEDAGVQEVWCPTTELGSWTAQQDGQVFLTGNSGWHWNALNRSSGAYGIPQSLPGSKMRSAGSDWRDNAGTQIRWGLGYIRGRYGSPAGAWAHSQRTGWYDEGGWLPPGPSLVYNGTGSPEPVLNGRQWDALVDGRSGGATEYHAHFDGMTQAAYQGQVRSAFHAMSVQDANRNRVGRRR